MTKKSALASAIKRYKNTEQEVIPLAEYVERCKKERELYTTAAERLVEAIGACRVVDTSKDTRLKRIFSNRKIRTYDAFNNFYGLEDPIDELVSVVKHAAQGLEESKQIILLLGPPGGGKSDIVRHLFNLFQSVPFYAIEGSPVYDNPLALFGPEDSEQLGIAPRYLNTIPSPWLTKRTQEYQGDLTKFNVVKLYPSKLNHIATARVEAGDEQNQDISSLVGKLDIRKVRDFSPSDPDAYDYSGGLCKGNRGLVEHVEMLKSPIKTLHPYLTCTQDQMYTGTESLPALPFEGMIFAHTNESEWKEFRADNKYEAFFDRMCIIKVPYCLRINEEVQIYEKLLNLSTLTEAQCAPKTLELLASYSVASRLRATTSSASDIEKKVKVYNGEDLKSKAENVKAIHVYRDDAGVLEGFSGSSTRFAFKTLSKTFNKDLTEVSADPVQLFSVLENQIKQEQYSKDEQQFRLALVEWQKDEYFKFLEREIKRAYLEAYEDYGQNFFDKYVKYAEARLDDDTCFDPETETYLDEEALESFLREVEDPSGITNPKDFRNDIVKFCLKYQAKHGGKNPKWTSYKRIRDVIEKKIFSNTDDLLPIISFSTKATTKDSKKHQEFVDRMVENGYSVNQVKRVVEWYLSVKKA